MFKLKRACLKASVIENNTVNAPVTVVGFFTEVTAVFGSAVFNYGVVCPLPAASADKEGICIKLFGISIKVTGAVTHRCGKFALENGAFVTECCKAVHIVD